MGSIHVGAGAQNFFSEYFDLRAFLHLFTLSKSPIPLNIYSYLRFDIIEPCSMAGHIVTYEPSCMALLTMSPP